MNRSRWTLAALLLSGCDLPQQNIAPTVTNSEPPKPRDSTVYATAREFVSASLKAPSTAKFATLEQGGSATGIGNGIWHVLGYVDSQNSFGAMLRSNWEMFLLVGDSGTVEMKYFRLGEDEVGDRTQAERYAEGYDPEHPYKLKDGVQVTGAALQRQRQAFFAEEEKSKLVWREKNEIHLRDSAALAASEAETTRERVERERLARAIAERIEHHSAAREAVVEWRFPQLPIKHSTLGAQDDNWTVCRQVSKGVWEAKGVFQTKAGRESWRALFVTFEQSKAVELLYAQSGTATRGNLSEVVRTHGLRAVSTP